MLDLDGVVYVGGKAVAGAPEALAAARDAGMRLAFITNNAARTPDTVAAHLVDLGVPAEAHDVVTSAQAAARVLADRLGRGARVVALGAEGLRTALEAEGLVPVGVDDDAAAIATGYGPEVPWRDIMRGAVLVRDGLWWLACNTDMTLPTPYGTAPGHGVLVDLIRRFSGVEPAVAGKPARPLLDETVRRVGGERPLMVGDRLDTDIEGAANADLPSLLVLTGVTGLPEIVAARPGERPTYISADLGGLAQAHAAPACDGTRSELGGWTADVVDGRLEVRGSGSPDDWWRVVAASAWAHLDVGGTPADITALRPPDGNLGA
jgi:glycerol-1-phosphatase